MVMKARVVGTPVALPRHRAAQAHRYLKRERVTRDGVDAHIFDAPADDADGRGFANQALQLLKTLPIAGAIVTGDAIFAQRKICRAVVDGGATTSSP